jgi:hypothetical protein
MRREWRAGLRGLAAAAVAAAALSGCGPMHYRAGTQFEPDLLEQRLKPDSSGEAEVRAALGEPYGRGRALMPYQDAPRTLWTYFFDQASIDIGSGKMESSRRYLFVFFRDGRLDSYMWFGADLR